MDFGKYQYERAKREREARKARKEIEVGMAVKVVFKEKREGRLSDFHMEPIKR